MLTTTITSFTGPKKMFTPSNEIPEVSLAGMDFVVNGQRLSLSRKSRAYRVIRAFFANSKPSLTSAQLLEILDLQEGESKLLSVRAQRSRHSALVRMLSRMRIEFQKSFEKLTPNGTTWFHYDRNKQQWVLFKMPSTGADGHNY